jgi:2-polyprenyl-3-methyl-5-hydroxy-6-metoxy-1,4-benzoquinol methylase
MTTLSPEQIHEEVRQRYGRFADEFKLEVQASCCDTSSESDCCNNSELYEVDISTLPDDVTGLSLGCGDPITLAELLPGQKVLDLGSGGGIDCFLAARQVGATGHVIGVDMTPSMLEKASRNKEKMGVQNVEFRQGQIEALPLDSNLVDVVVSNCVINLSPDKPAVFREAFRVLKPGGRIAVSDIVTQGRFSPEEKADMAAWTGCITGAEDVSDYVAAIKAAGFSEISVRDKAVPDVELADTVGMDGPARWFSARVTAVKPSFES